MCKALKIVGATTCLTIICIKLQLMRLFKVNSVCIMSLTYEINDFITFYIQVNIQRMSATERKRERERQKKSK